MDVLQARIAYQFKDRALLQRALTHPSLACESRRPQSDNQRLEFLGDAVIQLVLTDELYRRFPDAGEGQLTKLRSRLVSREALCQFAREINLGARLLLGKGEMSSGGRDRPSNLADAFEALAGAIYLDGGLDAARHFLEGNVRQLIEATLSQPEETNPKGELQERLQAITSSSPTYVIIDEGGPDHLKSFVAEVRWEGLALGQGRGGSKKEAEISAAASALRERRWESEKVREQLVEKSEQQ